MYDLLALTPINVRKHVSDTRAWLFVCVSVVSADNKATWQAREIENVMNALFTILAVSLPRWISQ